MAKQDKKEKSIGTQPKVISESRNKIQIIGDNILYNNGVIKAFYILPTMNYSTASQDGILRSITELTNLLSGLASQRPNVEFTIQRVDKTIQANDVKNNLLETIKMYRPDYDMPLEFSDNIRDDHQSYCLMCVDIQQKDFADIEEYTLLDTAKELFKGFITKITGLGNININEVKILDIEKNIYSTIRHKCVRASKELVFYNYVSRLYPSYEISYEKLSFVNEQNFTNIMGAVTQVVSDNFGWFELSNEGVDLFGAIPQSTYGCMIDVNQFPQKIYSSNFPMDYPGCVITIKCMKKDDAKLKLKRTRSADKFEHSQALQVEAESEAIEETAKSIAIATRALQELDAGETLCQFNCSILITGITREELKIKIQRVISDCKDRDILVSKSLNQALDFLDHYVNMKPKKYQHFANLQLPLSFQLNNGSIVGDVGTGLFSPSIGEDLT
jgi:hypothetical protein